MPSPLKEGLSRAKQWLTLHWQRPGFNIIISSMKTLNLALITLILALTGCNLSESTPIAVSQPTRPYLSIAQSVTIAPTATRLVRSIPTNTASAPTERPAPTISPFECGVERTGEHVQHEVLANLDYAAKSIEVSQIVRYRNEEDAALAEIVFAVEPNTWENAFGLESVTINETDPYYTLDHNRLTVRLPMPLNAGCVAEIQLAFRLNIPRIGIGATAAKGYFGYSDRQLNLGFWLPTPAARIGNEWLMHDPDNIGETNVLEQVDWNVTLNISNASNMLIAGAGTGEETGENQWHYTHNSARDFTLSMSQNYILSEQLSSNGVNVQLYHFSDTTRTIGDAQLDSAAHALDLATRAVEQYSTLFGAYPYERMVIVQGDFPDGMEFSGLAYVSTNWFYGFDGGIQNYLSIITIHEVSHQWWYSRVGNDSADAPWLDEALATYSEYIYIEEFNPESRDWWWSFRVAYYNPQGNVDSDVYQFETGRDYINAIYLRGVQMLQNIRDDIGTEEFFDFLAAYSQAGAGKIATPNLFWSLLTPEQLAATEATREEFLAEPPLLLEGLEEMSDGDN
jgi:hypothetical protein